ncbi:MBL fold metallo-hydrolase [Acutalibacter muris]|uniref:MBL fold metallo-hydrolase n=1 Tax=Acutalibacter muris TaxID=1796620 RepID=A0A1Z2XV15_9FIRM|nr:MBL fold metallo-hydrolase [Acutalibacter muris]ANU54482.1 MBL fold metallo-hydrolase [Hungateiclostridiaceae bacterium KB18]ASB42297.1 MBL fold metallo-hydrolase [Acutalibacter muris]QQR31577.1 MBL fold metallo-hydrolase [Acutalibacter muris]
MSNIHRIKCGNGNCYIIENESGGVLVDTGKREYAERVLERCRAYKVGLIILTHGHFDHAENAARISRELGIPIGMSELDSNLIEANNSQELSAGTFLGKIVLSVSLRDFSRREMQRFKPEVLLKDGDNLSAYGVDAKIIALPGHTAGSIGVDVGGASLIVGDALMNMFYPTVSMLYHDRRDMLESAKKISALGDRTIYFGHGGPVRNRRWVRS